IKLINKNKVAIPILLKKGNLQQKFKEAKELIINKQADAIITGINSPTKEVILFAIKNKKGLITSSELILTKNKTLLFADPSVIPFPDSKKLAEIASQSALTLKSINITPKIAFLSYSTKGSASHEKLDEIKKAVKIFKKKNPGIKADGELQLDSALDPKVAKIKNSKIIKGDANILIFPDLNSSNIGIKLVKKFGDAELIGPILQNTKFPINDLSRGCNAKQIYHLAAFTSVQK
ncbi:phosphate acetyltransferase, partial [archaeon]|nr:phosphate acetyltransferase [archaeon]